MSGLGKRVLVIRGKEGNGSKLKAPSSGWDARSSTCSVSVTSSMRLGA